MYGRQATCSTGNTFYEGKCIRSGCKERPQMVPARVSSQFAKAKRAAMAGNTPYQVIARVGYAARGIVYVIVGAAALSVAFGARKNALSITSALQELFRQPMGTIVILGIAGGLTCFAFWRIAQGLLDADKLGRSPRALFRRVAYAISSIAYFALAAIAIGALF